MRSRSEDPALATGARDRGRRSEEKRDARCKRTHVEVSAEIEAARSRLASRNQDVEVALRLTEARAQLATREEELAAVRAAAAARAVHERVCT